ncbi:hypothetical protein [Brevundimonas sp.]|uniref:hypothetical protein n=1 Tax=Brevundimonas sp. TaxID=1871086 RepID=UPI003D6CDFEA
MKFARTVGLIGVACVLLAGGRVALNQTNLCLSEGRNVVVREYQVAALRYATAYKMTLAPEVPPSVTEAALEAHINANPDCCVFGKVGFSEYEPPPLEAKLTGQASKIVSLSTGTISGSRQTGYTYVFMNNCGDIYERMK